jgi:peptidoglycan/xylan/chitin deacetylase (PgdA/CDA1 family)
MTAVPPVGLLDRIRNLADTLLVQSPAQPFLAGRTSSRLVVLAYHDVADEDLFRTHIEYLKSTMRPVSMNQVLTGLRGDTTALPSSAVLITFDDANRTIYDRALPILSSLDVPAVAFVVAGHLDSDRPFWWEEVRQLITRGAHVPEVSPNIDLSLRNLKNMPDPERRRVVRALRRSLPDGRMTVQHLRSPELSALEAGGVSVGNHTFTHPLLNRCSERRVRSEIERSHRVLVAALGHEPRAFAYPNGNYDPRAAEVIKGLGYEAAFLFDHRVAHFPPEDVFRISRVRVNSTTPLNRFKLIMSGLHPALHHAIGRS